MNLSKAGTVLIFLLGIFSAASATEVCTAIADASNGKVLFERGECKQQVTPASTFKIAISLMGCDSGFLKDEHSPALPYRAGYVDWRESWRHPSDPAKWMQDSVVWFSQQVTLSLGKERFAKYVKKFEYGNADVSGDLENDGLTMSWISSSLRISPLEQLSFLLKVVNRRLNVSPRAYDMTAELTKFNQSPGGWEIHGKTGSASGFGWYVGWASKGSRTFTFARLIRNDKSDAQDIPAGVLARDAFIAEYPMLVTQLTR